MPLLSVREAASKYPLSVRQIARLAQHRVIDAHRFGKTWAIDEDSLRSYLATERKPGPKRP